MLRAIAYPFVGLLIGTAGLTSRAVAQDAHRGFFATIGAGGTGAGDVRGLAVTAGVSLRAGPFLFNANAADLTLSRGDTGPYYRDEFSNGESRCRNRENGQFADDAKCMAVDVNYAASADVSLFVPRTRVFIGAGSRVGGDHNAVYGTLGVALGSRPRTMWVVRGNIGDDYVSGLVLFAFKF